MHGDGGVAAARRAFFRSIRLLMVIHVPNTNRVR